MSTTTDRGKRKAAVDAAKRLAAAMIGITVGAPIVYYTGLGRFAWVALLLIGAAFIAEGGRRFYRALNVKSWPKAPGRILGTGVGEAFEYTRTNIYTLYYPTVEFEYESPAGRFTSDRYTIAHQDHRDLDPAVPERVIARYPAGTAVEVFVHPRDPRLAVLRADVSLIRRLKYLSAIGGGLLICGFGWWVAVYTMP